MAIAIVPIKFHSSRVPGKNYRLCNGKPLFVWVLTTLLAASEIERIIVDTDSALIRQGVAAAFPGETRITLYARPATLCGDDVSTNLLLENVIADLALTAEYYVHTHVTNPLLRADTVDAAIRALRAHPTADSLFGVQTHYARFYTHDGRDMNHNRYELIPTQNLDPVYQENSCIYVFPPDTLARHHARIGPRAMMFPMSSVESTDIDWPDDFIRAEYLLKTHADAASK